MCARFTQKFTWKGLWELYQMPRLPMATEFEPQYNIAPTDRVLIVREPTDGYRETAFTRWGFLPQRKGGPLINAKGETLATTPAFADAFRSRRCLVPASGFYEWPTKDTPHYILREDGLPLTFAGLWTRQERDGQAIETCTVVTCSPNAFMGEIHHRMPVILTEKAGWDRWLTPDTPSDALQELLSPRDWPGVVKYPVSRTVNHVRNKVPECIVPLGSPAAPAQVSLL